MDSVLTVLNERRPERDGRREKAIKRRTHSRENRKGLETMNVRKTEI